MSGTKDDQTVVKTSQSFWPSGKKAKLVKNSMIKGDRLGTSSIFLISFHSFTSLKARPCGYLLLIRSCLLKNFININIINIKNGILLINYILMMFALLH